ncbi:MAG: three-Cys-motif partner protein TcmP [Desulfobacterales bacterium]|nr:three-Cys-motif partner protein TcmP [Desulfobacterales bacterium]
MKQSSDLKSGELFYSLKDDGLPTPEVRAWSNKKYNLIERYARTFAKSMKNKWGTLVYLDLYAGAGKARIKNTHRIVSSSPLIVMDKCPEFDKYIFCEADSEKCNALRQRANAIRPDANVDIFNEDANVSIEKIMSAVPKASHRNTVLSFCFIDPFNLDDFDFQTIEKLSQLFIDFMVLIPTGMDANRNQKYYFKGKNGKLDRFLGSDSWRERWDIERKKVMPVRFEEFVAGEFNRSMIRLGFKDPGIKNCCPIRSDSRNLLLYRLCVYSRHALGKKFWEIAQEYSNPQMELTFG